MRTLTQHFGLRTFGFRYEDLPAFHAAYFMLIVIFAGIFNLGFFAVLIVAHIALDFVKYRRLFAKRNSLALFAVFRESLTDIALFFLALSTVVYLHPTLPSIAILTGNRLTHVVIVRGLAILLPKLTILHHSLRIIFNTREYLATPHPRLKRIWSLSECLYVSTLFLALCSLAIAPGMLNLDLKEFGVMLMQQLVPWKF